MYRQRKRPVPGGWPSEKRRRKDDEKWKKKRGFSGRRKRRNGECRTVESRGITRSS
jgi:hypothetical protein